VKRLGSGLGKPSVTNGTDTVYEKLSTGSKGSIAAFKIMYRDEQESGMVFGGMAKMRRFLRCGKPMRRSSMAKLLMENPPAPSAT
jgi:hypothetical protein